ncbi:MAG: sigma 54-interacting transcriptional regulator, partial [Clostridiales bacterium]|nr:sigma 54-interacting transcriptional regulator [Clostridiales bacterium]
MQAKERVYEALKESCSGNRKITAADLADKLNLSRQVVSHYLTRLMEDGLAVKTSTRPVYWFPVTSEDLEFFGEDVWGNAGTKPGPAAAPGGDSDAAAPPAMHGNTDAAAPPAMHGNPDAAVPPAMHDNSDAARPCSVFSSMVGYAGSQKQTVEMCMAAVNYPPDGLPMLLTGESGVGKSFIARLIHAYALSQGVIEANAPFVVLNCADYANNPELLSATLLGYKKGSFTGADKDRDGLLKEADGGYLFLDEVHRLSFENQEKLFLFMDSGQYRPLGDNMWKSSRVRFIFATTENPDEVLLETFRRRITLQVPIPSMMDRPLKERLQMLYLFYQKEARKVGRRIEVEGEVAQALMLTRLQGNIGKLENLIQVSCANAFYRQGGSD